MIKFLVGIVLLSSLVGCSSTEQELLDAIKICEPNGGIAIYFGDHEVVCRNGVKSTNPSKTIKYNSGDKSSD